LWLAADIAGRRRPGRALLAHVIGPHRYDRAALGRHLLIVSAVASYALWLGMFPVIRYLSGLEAIVPLILVVTLTLFGAPARGAALAVILFAIAAVPFVGYKAERVPLGQDFFRFRQTDFSANAGALVVMTGFEGLSFVIPFFPSSTRFVRLQATVNWTERSDQTGYAGMRDRARGILAAHEGPIRVLFDAVGDGFSGPEPANTDADLARFGLARVDATCRMIEGERGRREITLCDVERLAN